MKFHFLYILLILLVSSLNLKGQQVNPFELRTEDSISVSEVNNTAPDTGSSAIKVIEDTLIQPSINPSPKNNPTPIENPAPSPENSATISETTPSPENSTPQNTDPKNTNPFELVNSSNQTFDENQNKIDTTSSETLISDTPDQQSTPEPPEIKEKTKPPATPPKESRNLIVLWASLLSGLLIAVSLNNKRSILTDIGKSLRNLSYMKLLQKEQRNGWSTSYIILHVVYLINISFFVRFLCIHFEIPLLGYSIWKIGILLFFILAIRHISLYVISFMRKRLSEVLNYNFIIVTANIITGIFLIPINLFIAFSGGGIAKTALFIGIVIICISFLTRWFRALVNSLRVIIGDSFHFLLYLCSCEIVPIIILVGYVRNLIN